MFRYITILISINHASHVTLILNTVKKYSKRNGVMIGVILSLGKLKTAISFFDLNRYSEITKLYELKY